MTTAARASVRAFTPEDYDAYARVRNAVFPEHPSTAEELRRQDETEAAEGRLRAGRFVAQSDGDLVGFGEYYQNPGMYHPRRFVLNAGVLEAHRGRGLGRALFERVLEALAPLDPLTVRVTTSESDARTLRFLAERDFREDKRFWDSTLDVASFDFAPFEGLEASVRAAGYEIVSAADVSADPAWREKYHELFSAIRVDVPRTEPATPITFERFVEYVIEDPNFIPEATFFALKDGEYVGTSDLYGTGASEDLFIGLTGVRREHRRHGLATALKLRGVAYARERGVPRLHTGNESNNRPMLSINDRFGFQRRPAQISFVKTLAEEGA